MADRVQRFASQNAAALTATVVSASSRDTGFPPSRVKTSDPLDVWRSKLGWNVVAGENDALDFKDGTTKRVAYIAPGNYASGALLATRITTDLLAAGLWPAELSPTGWWKADALLGTLAQDGAVATWADSSGNARDLTQVVEAKMPVFRRSAINGRAAVYFDGARELSGAVLSQFLAANGVGSVFVVYQRNADATGRNALFSSGANASLQNDGATLYAMNNDGAADTASMATVDGWNVAHWIHDHAGTTIRVGQNDGDAAAGVAVATGATTSLATALEIGWDSANAGRNWEGFIAEVIVFNTVLTEENRRRIHKYLVAKYKLENDASTAPAWTNVVTATYNADAAAFTIARTSGAGALDLSFATGPNLAQSAALDLAFAASDLTGSTTYTGTATYHSREWIQFDLGTGRTRQVVALFGNNGTSAAVFEAASSALPYFAGASWVTLYGSKARVAWDIAQTERRYVRIRVKDVANPSGFSEIGHVYDGNYFQPSRSAAFGIDRSSEAIGTLAMSDAGTPMANRRANRRNMRNLSYPRLTRVDRNGFRSIYDGLGEHSPFLVAWDPVNVPTDVQLCFFDRPITEEMVPGDGDPFERWRVTIDLLGVPL